MNHSVSKGHAATMSAPTMTVAKPGDIRLLSCHCVQSVERLKQMRQHFTLGEVHTAWDADAQEISRASTNLPRFDCALLSASSALSRAISPLIIWREFPTNWLHITSKYKSYHILWDVAYFGISYFQGEKASRAHCENALALSAPSGRRSGSIGFDGKDLLQSSLKPRGRITPHGFEWPRDFRNFRAAIN
jgi:hypothetical protein